MKKVFLFFTALFSYLAVQAQAKETVNFSGTVSGDTKGFDKIYYYSEGHPVPDSVTIVNGKFSFSVPFTGRYTQLFYTQYEMKMKGYMTPFQVLVDGPGTISMENIDISQGFLSATIKGNKTAELFHSFLKKQQEIFKEADRQANHLRDSVTNSLMSVAVTDLAKKNPEAFVTTYIMNGYAKSFLSADQLQKAYSFLSSERKVSDDGKRVAAFISGLQGAAPGNAVKNFILNDSSGVAVDFKSFRGKYVWIDFWTSWCGPCRQAFPHMREIYAKYRGKNFEIVGISADATKAPWLKALASIKNPWLQLWDNKSVTDQFAVTGYPTSFLIDPQGKILVKEIGYDPNEKGLIEKELEKIFQK